MPQGTIQAKGFHIIAFLIIVSVSRITNGVNVLKANSEPVSGLMYSLHIIPFFMFSLTIPVSRFRKK